MPVFGQRDLRAFFRPMGVPVAFGGVSTYPDDGSPVMGLLDTPLQIKLQDVGIGGAQVELPELRLPFNAFSPMPASRDTVTVDGTDYTVSAPTAEDDGAILCYQLNDL
jgi:hypothetical protein